MIAHILKEFHFRSATLHIREALQTATKEELDVLPQAWEIAGFPSSTPTKSGVLKEPEFDLGKVKGFVKLTKSK